MNFLKKITGSKNEGKYVLSLDVGTRVAKALVSHLNFEQDTVTHIGIGRAAQEPGSIVGGRIADVPQVVAACREAIADARSMAGVEAKEAVMGFSGSTVKVRTHTFEITRISPQERMGSEELKGIIRDIHTQALEEIKRGLTYREKEAGIKLVAADIVDFSIDGYRVLNPLNFKGCRLRISISSSFVTAADFATISGIADELGLKLNQIAYGPYAVIKALGAGDALGFNAVLIDVGGNITDVVLVKNGNIVKAGMFILGGHLFTKRLANRLHIGEEAAEDLKLKYAKGMLKETDCRRIESLLAEDVELWLSGVELILEEGGSKMLIPHRLLFYGGGSQLPGVVGSLNHLKKTNIPFSDKIKLDFISIGHIAGSLDQTNELNDFQDTTLVGLSHLGLDTIDEQDAANHLLSEIILKK